MKACGSAALCEAIICLPYISYEAYYLSMNVIKLLFRVWWLLVYHRDCWKSWQYYYIHKYLSANQCDC